ncbi:MAG: hypothetical protein JO341_00495 [Gammaproteobacteria bacterium]|nr:hypothetical protein [Gammaproteobacteria bacterium]MBV9619477.1 hypothetical protein [Gammaproteobacteria bacterium]
MRSLALLLLSILTVPAALAGAVLKIDRKDSGKTVPHEVYYAQDGMLRVDSVDERGTVQSMDVVRDGVIWEVNMRERTFSRVDANSMKQMMGDKTSQFDAALAQLPPEQRAAIQAQLAQTRQRSSDDNGPVFSDTGRTDQVGQYSCRIWTEAHEGKPFAEYCVVPTSNLPAGNELADAMKKAYATVTQAFSGIPEAAASTAYLRRIEKMHGFPARRRSLGASEAQDEDQNVLASAEARTLPADQFAIPKGFTEKPLR